MCSVQQAKHKKHSNKLTQSAISNSEVALCANFIYQLPIHTLSVYYLTATFKQPVPKKTVTINTHSQCVFMQKK